MIDPVGLETFLNKYWDEQPLVATGSATRNFDDLLTVSTVDELLSTGQLKPPNIRLVRSGSPVDFLEQASEPPTIDVGKVATAFHDGATVIVQQLHHWWYPIAVFCRQIEGVLGHPTQANAYLSPPSAQGLPLHHDTHDVFVLQASGSKHWRVYHPAEPLPLPHQWYDHLDRPDEEPAYSFTLHTGDVLYLPRGWRHEATTRREESLHLTIGVHVYTWIDALRDALLDCDDELELRRAVPPNGAPPAGLSEMFTSRLNPADVALRMRRRFVGTRRPILHRHLEQLRDRTHLTAHGLVQRRATVIADLDTNGDRPALRFEGKELLFPPQSHAAIRFCHLATEPFTPADLPVLDDEGRLVLVRRLVMEGFLEILEQD